MTFARRFLVLILALLIVPAYVGCSAEGCNDPLPDVSPVTPTIHFPDAQPDGTLPLDPADGFPFRVEVCTPASQLQGSLNAHVWVSSGVGPAFVPMTMTDVPTLALEMGADGGAGCGPGLYSAVGTLDAPGPGIVTVGAEVDGQVSFDCAVIGPPLASFMPSPACALPDGGVPASLPLIELPTAPTALAIWNGPTPRYSICAETAATKGSVTLTSADPGLVQSTQMPLTGTLLQGPCAPPVGPTGFGKSHVSFDLTLTPPGSSTPFTAVATLSGMPVVPEPVPYTWAASVTVGADPPLVTLTQPTVVTATPAVSTAAGVLYTASTKATMDDGNTPIEGLTITFSTAAMPGAFTSVGSMATDANGMASLDIFVPDDAQIVVEVAGGGATNASDLTTAEAPTIALSQPTFAATTTLLPTGQVFAVTTQATNATTMAAAEGVSVAFTTTTTGLTFSPTPVMTDTMGNATSYVVVSYNTGVAVEVAGGGAVSAATLPSAQIPLLTLRFTPAPAQINKSPDTWLVTVTASLGTTLVPGVGVAFSVLPSPGSANALISPSAATTNASGVATAYVDFLTASTGAASSVVVVASGGGYIAGSMPFGP